MMEIRNATDAGSGVILCEINHPKFGWIPFSARADDVEKTGREIYALAVAGDVAPMPEPSKDEIDAKAKRIKDIADEEAAKADEKLKAFSGMSPDEVRAWIGKNVKDVSAVTDVLATLAVAVSVLTRKL